jgi:hypothetical protein
LEGRGSQIVEDDVGGLLVHIVDGEEEGGGGVLVDQAKDLGGERGGEWGGKNVHQPSDPP